jgi:hypothetical protein
MSEVVLPVAVGARPPARSRRTHLRLSRLVLGAGLHLVPRRHRFGAALRLAPLFAPLLRRLGFGLNTPVAGVETDLDRALVRVLNTLDRVDAGYDPHMRVEGADALRAAVNAGRGVLLASPHTMLSTLVVRWLDDHGVAYTVLAQKPYWRITGRPRSVPTIQPSRGALLAVRRRLAAGDVICAMIDKKRSEGARVLCFNTAAGPMLLDDGLLDLAFRAGAAVLFLSARLDGDEVLVRLQPAPVGCTDAACITAGFIAFVQAHVERIRATASPRARPPG